MSQRSASTHYQFQVNSTTQTCTCPQGQLQARHEVIILITCEVGFGHCCAFRLRLDEIYRGGASDDEASADEAEPGASAGVTRTGQKKRKNKQGKGKAYTRTRLLAKSRQILAAKRAAAAADDDEHVANLPRSEDLEQDELPPFVPALRARAVPDVTRTSAASWRTRSITLACTGSNAGAAAAEVVDREAQLANMEAKLKKTSDELDHLRQTCENQSAFIHTSLDMVHPSALASGSGVMRALAPAPAPAPPVAPAFTPVLKALELRKPKPFSGKGDAAQHGYVCSFSGC